MPTSDPAYFQAIPWCADLLADAEFMTVPSRFGKPNRHGAGELFTKTFATDSTIRALIYQIRRSGQKRGPIETNGQPLPIVPEIRAFLDTRSGISGWPGIAHGGFVAAMIDEVLGFLINSNREATESAGITPENGQNLEPGQRSAVSAKPPRSGVMTGELTTKYRMPVPAGEVLVIYAWIEKLEGRKIFARASIEDGEGQVLSEGSAIFIRLKPGFGLPKAIRKSSKM